VFSLLSTSLGSCGYITSLPYTMKFTFYILRVDLPLCIFFLYPVFFFCIKGVKTLLNFKKEYYIEIKVLRPQELERNNFSQTKRETTSSFSISIPILCKNHLQVLTELRGNLLPPINPLAIYMLRSPLSQTICCPIPLPQNVDKRHHLHHRTNL